MPRIRALLLSATAAVMLTAVAGGLLVSAHTTTGVVNAFHCLAGHGGATTVDAGSTVAIRVTWATQLLADLRTFREAQLSLASWNDGQMVDVSDEWSRPEAIDGGWQTALEVPTGTTLAAPGDQMRFTFTLVLMRALAEQPGPTRYEPGLQFGGTCTVTAV